MRPSRSVLLARILAAGWALLTAVLLLVSMPSSQAVPRGPRLAEAMELTAHLVLFGVLAWLVRWGFVEPDEPQSDSRVQWIRALCVYCVGLEVLQLQIPQRGFEVLDIVLGLAGIGLGFFTLKRRAADLYSATGR